MEGKAIIVTGGSGPYGPAVYEPKAGDLVICADSGYELAQRLGLAIDFWVGDFDSTEAHDHICSPSLVVKRSPTDKDQSDTELALMEARAAGYQSWILLGGGGRRIDHLFATYALFDRYGPPLIWQTGHESMYLVTESMTFSPLGVDQTVSLLPARLGSTSRVTASQLMWPLYESELSFSSISLSNRTTSTSLTVDVVAGSGILVCFPVADRLR